MPSGEEERQLKELIERPDACSVCACFSVYLKAFHLERKLVTK